MGCAVGTVKFAVFIFNFLLVCLGFAMVLFGFMDNQLPDGIKDIPSMVDGYTLTSKVLIIAGSIVFVVAFFGCWGAVSDSSCMLFLYAVFLMGIILVEAAAGVYVYVNRDTIKDTTSKELKQWIQEYSNNPSQAKTIIDNVQSKLKCCGVDGISDWKGQIPTSCCEDKAVKVCDPNKAFPKGCLNKGLEIFNSTVKKSWYIVGAIVGVEILTIVFALVVRNSILNERRRSLA